MTAGLLEVEETIEHLEPGDDVSCDVRGCEAAAFWWATCRGCRNRSALCVLCAIRLEIVHSMVGAICLLCGRSSSSFAGVIELEPIGRVR